MNYTLHQLQVFLKVAQTGSITKAAEELFLTQPAVSIQIKNFQQQFDIPLTETIGRKLHISEFGWEIAHAAEKILNEVYAINYKSISYKGLLSGRLKVATVSTGKYVMPYFLSGFIKKHNNIELLLDVTNKQQVLQSLLNNEVDMALVTILPEKPAVDSMPIMTNYFHLFGPVEEQKTIKLSDLSTLPFLNRERGSGTRITMENYLSKHGISPKNTIEFTSNEAIKQAVLAGLGYSIMSVFGWKNEFLAHRIRAFKPPGMPLKNTWHLVWNKGKAHSPVAAAFLDYIQKEKDNIIKAEFSWIEQAGFTT